MSAFSRRGLLLGATSAVLLAAGTAQRTHAAMRPEDKFDLVVKGGEVVDPSQSLRAKRDVGIRYGIVEALDADIPAARALRVLDASGKLMTLSSALISPGPRATGWRRTSFPQGAVHSRNLSACISSGSNASTRAAGNKDLARHVHVPMFAPMS